MKQPQNFLATKDLLNKKLYTINDIQTKTLLEYHIIGVMKNFNFSSLRDVVTPLAFFWEKTMEIFLCVLAQRLSRMLLRR